LDSLLKVLVGLGGGPRYASAAQPLVDISPALLPIAVTMGPGVNIVEQEISSYFLQLVFLQTVGKIAELREVYETILIFLETQQEDVGIQEYLFKKTIVLNV
jgi:hypothetical protein